MKIRNNKVEPLKKVTLELEAGTMPGSMDLSPGPSRFEFIFGLGKEGLTPFEFELSGKVEGDTVVIFVRQEVFTEAFQHIRIPTPGVTHEVESFHLKATVKKIEPADQGEVIGALADIANCGDHCCGH